MSCMYLENRCLSFEASSSSAAAYPCSQEHPPVLITVDAFVANNITMPGFKVSISADGELWSTIDALTVNNEAGLFDALRELYWSIADLETTRADGSTAHFLATENPTARQALAAFLHMCTFLTPSSVGDDDHGADSVLAEGCWCGTTLAEYCVFDAALGKVRSAEEFVKDCFVGTDDQQDLDEMFTDAAVYEALRQISGTSF